MKCSENRLLHSFALIKHNYDRDNKQRKIIDDCIYINLATNNMTHTKFSKRN